MDDYLNYVSTSERYTGANRFDLHAGSEQLVEVEMHHPTIECRSGEEDAACYDVFALHYESSSGNGNGCNGGRIGQQIEVREHTICLSV